ncbi:MAG: hypothetical protein ACTH2U_03110 [Brevibacterium sp.]|uniref:hypothetical protein n=1 Tax=Brevibacterium sp. GP-SGM9 TaxID=3376990 RepID=UPI0039A5B103
MPFYSRRRPQRSPLVGCALAAVIMFALGLAGIVVAIVAVLVVGDRSSSDPDAVDPQPTSSTTAPTTGGWSSGG